MGVESHTGQSEPNANCALLAKSDRNRYDPVSALSSPSFFIAESASSNRWSGCGETAFNYVDPE